MITNLIHFQFVVDLSQKTKIAKNVLSDLSERAQDSENCSGRQTNEESCCIFDESKLKFDKKFGEEVT